MQTGDVLAQLVAMTSNLGDPANDYAILGEGNTSARAGAEHLLGQGQRRRDAHHRAPAGFVRGAL